MRLISSCALFFVIHTLYGPAATISDPGKYELGDNVDYNGATPDSIIRITTSNVTLDMMNRVITYTGNTAGMSGIVVDSGLSNITIQNGSILNVTGTAIRIGSGCSRIQISHIETHSSSLCGIALEGIVSSIVRDCSITNCALLHTPTAIAIHFGFQNTIQNNAISQITCGIQLHSGQSNLIQNNTITNIIQTATHESSLAAGILTNTVELGSIILANTIMTSTVQGSAHPYGIKLTYTTSSFTTVTNAVHGAISNSATWSPDGRYLAISGNTSGGIEIRVYEFNGTLLTQVATAAHGTFVSSVSWSPDGQYLAIGGSTSGGIEIRVYEFNGTLLTQVATAAHGTNVSSVSWSPDGRYLAIGGSTASLIQIRIYTFSGISLTQVATAGFSNAVFSVSWSPDGQYLTIGGGTSGGIQIRIYTFSGISLTQVATAGFSNAVFSVSWSPNGQYLANASRSNSIFVNTALIFPQKIQIIGNIINNIIGNASGITAGFARGRGISGSSSANVIQSNYSSFCNINYEYVTDVFKQFQVNSKEINQGPTTVSNLSYPPL